MEKRWLLDKIDKQEADRLAAELGVAPIVAGILLQRGLHDKAAARKFLYIDEQEFYDPFLFKDMEKAAARIEKALQVGEKITVYGDYDVDGMTSTALLLKTLRLLGGQAAYYVPDRQREGYGFNAGALQQLQQEGTKLLISVDCGISSADLVQEASSDMDIIITDHHLPPGEIPKVLAVLDPHLEDEDYPFQDLAGVGVVFKLCQALWQKIKGEAFQQFLDLAALGTVADIVPLRSENRKLTSLGLERMVTAPSVGVQALIENAGLSGKKISAGQVGFQLAPRLNAAGRLGSAALGIELLLAEDKEKALLLAERLNELNTRRQKVEQEILTLAETELSKKDMKAESSLVIAGAGWHIGVIGLAASRLVEEYYRPTIVIGISDGIGRGSCRSIPGFNIYEALAACQQYLLGFGGHAQAAGLSLQEKNIVPFRQAFDTYVRENISAESYLPLVHAAAELKPSSVDIALVQDLARLEPFGMGNPRPLFQACGLRGRYAQAIGREGRHLRFSLLDNNRSIQAIAWQRGSEAEMVNQGVIDIIYAPEINEWQGKKNVQCKIEDLRSADRLSREILGKLYIFFRHRQENGYLPLANQNMLIDIETCGLSLDLEELQLALRIFAEIGLLQKVDSGYFMLSPKEKLTLADSPSYCARQVNTRNFGGK